MVKKTKEEINTYFDDVGDKKFKIRVSSQALAILSRIEDFDYDDFEEWWVKNCAMVGGAQLLAYLELKERTDKRGD